MPVPRKRKNETWKEYIYRLTEHYIEEGYKPKQAYAIAHSVARRKKKKLRTKKK